MYSYTRAQLFAAGLVVNHHMYLAGRWFYCRSCGRNTRHYAMSHRGLADCFEVCEECDTYNGQYPCEELEEKSGSSNVKTGRAYRNNKASAPKPQESERLSPRPPSQGRK